MYLGPSIKFDFWGEWQSLERIYKKKILMNKFIKNRLKRKRNKELILYKFAHSHTHTHMNFDIDDLMRCEHP